MKIFIRAGAAAALLITTMGALCTAPSTQGLVQTVRIEPAEPHPGDQITITTVVTNTGPIPKACTFKICGLLFAGDLEVSEVPGTFRCQAYSSQQQLAPGESVEAVDTKVVDSPAGTYALEVRYLLDPAMSQRITVRVLSK